jgi:hypothetical protein
MNDVLEKDWKETAEKGYFPLYDVSTKKTLVDKMCL